MKNILALILLLSLLLQSQTKTVVFGGFSSQDSKDSLVSFYFQKYVADNLTAQKCILDEAKRQELNFLFSKHGNLFLAAREMLENAAAKQGVKLTRSVMTDPELKNQLKLPDYLIYGQLKFSTKKIDLSLEVYSTDKRTTVYKNVFDGRLNALPEFYHKVTQSVLVAVECSDNAINPIGFTDNADFAEFMRFSEYRRKSQFDRILDELEALPQLVQKYPELSALYKESLEKAEKSTPSVLGEIREQSGLDSSKNTDPAAWWAQQLIFKGYKLKHKTDIIKDAEDTSKVNIMVYYNISLRKTQYDLLQREMKKRKADNRFSDMGRYFFSADPNESETFKDVILKQKLVLKTFNEKDEELFRAELAIDRMTFEGGGYRHTDSQTFPVMPLGPADAAFNLKKKTDGVFIFDEVEKSKFRQVRYAIIEIVFE